MSSINRLCLIITLLLSTAILTAQSTLVDIQLALSKVTCSDLFTAAKFEKSVIGTSSKQGEVTLIKCTSLIYDSSPENNTFYILNEDLEKIKNLENIKNKTVSFLDLLPANNVENWAGNGLLIQTIKESNEEILVVLYRVEGKFMGFISKIGRGQSVDEEYLNVAFQKAKEKLQINHAVWYGSDTDKVNIYKIAEQNGFEVFRRSPYVDTELPTFISNSDPIQSQIFEPKTSVAFNCVPTAREDLINAGFSPDNSTAWNLLKNNINSSIQDKFINKPSTVEEFKNEIINGESDVLLMVAHSDKVSIYLGNEKIEINDIKAWEDRQIKNNKPRIAILLSCYAGEIEQLKTNWFFFQAQRESLTEVLLQKKYVDYIISPNHQISAEESLQIIDEILKSPSIRNLRNLFAGWHAFVFTENRK